MSLKALKREKLPAISLKGLAAGLEKKGMKFHWFFGDRLLIQYERNVILKCFQIKKNYRETPKRCA